MTELIPYHRPVKIEGKVWPILTNGPNVKRLEEWIKDYYDVKEVIACSSASIGLLLCLQVLKKLGFKKCSTPAFGWFSSDWAIRSAGYTLRYMDIDPETWLIYQFVSDIVLPVHTFGNVISLDDPFTIYDGAHALGAKIKDFGFATVISLAPTKMVTSGEGGLILMDDTQTAKEVRELRDKVSRMSEFNAQHALQLLPMLESILYYKKICYHYYKDHLPGQFQKIPITSSYNTIGMLSDLEIPEHIETRKYYVPLQEGFEHTDYVYSKIQCLPSWFGVDYTQIVEDILEHNKLIEHKTPASVYEGWP